MGCITGREKIIIKENNNLKYTELSNNSPLITLPKEISDDKTNDNNRKKKIKIIKHNSSKQNNSFYNKIKEEIKANKKNIESMNKLKNIVKNELLYEKKYFE